ncbi:unnamed protein product [Prorocentrum cordatum]|uniref:Uncharacterized protein n=1 Tax=Prorocentrum cordatum TaxID=2364126 RepID=A0ABN9TGN0_9DINO|nr:unnamed protein product [Polarella glacialis]
MAGPRYSPVAAAGGCRWPAAWLPARRAAAVALGVLLLAGCLAAALTGPAAAAARRRRRGRAPAGGEEVSLQEKFGLDEVMSTLDHVVNGWNQSQQVQESWSEPAGWLQNASDATLKQVQERWPEYVDWLQSSANETQRQAGGLLASVNLTGITQGQAAELLESMNQSARGVGAQATRFLDRMNQSAQAVAQNGGPEGMMAGGMIDAQNIGKMLSSTDWDDVNSWEDIKKEFGKVQGNRPGLYAQYAQAESAAVAGDIEVDFVWTQVPHAAVGQGVGVFASLQFGLEAGGGGYFGMQVVSAGAMDVLGVQSAPAETHAAIFSCWDLDPEHKVEALGPNCQRFDGEGTGGHCKIPFSIDANGKYTVRLHVEGHNASHGALKGEVVNPSTGQTIELGSLLLPNADGVPEGWGKIKTQSGAFLEFFKGTGCDDQPVASVGLVGPYFEQRSLSPPSAKAQYAPGCPWSDVSGCVPGEGCASPHVQLTGGGATQRTTADGEDLWTGSPAQGAPEAGCVDKDADIVQAALAIGKTISGCAEAASYCTGPLYGAIVTKLCCATCAGSGGGGALPTALPGLQLAGALPFGGPEAQ